MALAYLIDVRGAVHPLLIGCPIALLALVTPLDVVYLMTRDAFWWRCAFSLEFVGVILALVTAVPLTVDWLATPTGTVERRVGAVRLVVAAAALVPFVIGLFWRLQRGGPYQPTGLPLSCWSSQASSG